MMAEAAVIEPDLPIVDPHHHLWDFPHSTYLVPEMMENLSSGHNVRATVFVQCGAMIRENGPEELRTLGETEFVNGVAASFASGIYGTVRPCKGVVAQVDLMHGAAAGAVLDRHAAAAGERFKGIRHITAWNSDSNLLNPRNRVFDGMMATPEFRAGFAELGKRNLVFDAWLLHPQIDELYNLANSFPDTAIVLNHLGGPIGVGPYSGRRQDAFEEWRLALGRLAACGNVVLKVGGLGMPMCGFDFHLRDERTSEAEIADKWRPYVMEAISLFGPDRCMFESNFPVDRISCDYITLWNVFKLIAAGFTASEKAMLFQDTASRIYSL
ncbi:amidohydrolase family protein [Phyllobacterium sp. SB3]|uniref:amidohydrolase family protein n=1 Tax=Phyllobacterium sp. SB3 TaxID=3156073 RepID=UPI0032AF11F8